MLYRALISIILLLTLILLADPVTAAENGAASAPGNGTAQATEKCDGRLVYVDDPSEVSDNYPIFMETNRAVYVMRGSCFYLPRDEFGGGFINFFTLGRAPQGFDGDFGVMIVKSIRTFAEPIAEGKIKLSRNKGWYLPDSAKPNKMSIVIPLREHPIDTSIAEWNSLYLTPQVPELFVGLGVQWHAYASEDKQVYSTQWLKFWTLKDPDDFQDKTVTNYLLRYPVNSTKISTTPVRFFIGAPDGLQRVDLAATSSIGWEVHYTFLFK